MQVDLGVFAASVTFPQNPFPGRDLTGFVSEERLGGSGQRREAGQRERRLRGHGAGSRRPRTGIAAPSYGPRTGGRGAGRGGRWRSGREQRRGWRGGQRRIRGRRHECGRGRTAPAARRAAALGSPVVTRDRTTAAAAVARRPRRQSALGWLLAAARCSRADVDREGPRGGRIRTDPRTPATVRPAPPESPRSTRALWPTEDDQRATREQPDAACDQADVCDGLETFTAVHGVGVLRIGTAGAAAAVLQLTVLRVCHRAGDGKYGNADDAHAGHHVARGAERAAALLRRSVGVRRGLGRSRPLPARLRRRLLRKTSVMVWVAPAAI